MNHLARHRPIIFVWENFGPLHVDRCEALARDVPEIPVIGLEILSRSSDYDWIIESSNSFKKITLSSPEERDPWSPWKIISAIASNRPQAVFFCHYQRPEILLAAFMVRALGIKTFTMNDSKFDDYRRDLWREAVKTFFLLPYQGALAASQRSADYLRFLGIQRHHIALGYDAVSVSRIRHLANSAPAPGGEDFANRHFTIVARLIPKKNIALALRALAILARANKPRRLVICGSGPLESELKALSQDLGLSNLVEFKGFVQTEEVCRTLATSLALILPSTEEQFGQVIPEALSMGVPVLVSDNCGARDHLVKTGINGFVFEPSNAEGLAFFMRLLSSSESTWTEMAKAAADSASLGDVGDFVNGVRQLLGAVSTQAKSRPRSPRL